VRASRVVAADAIAESARILGHHPVAMDRELVVEPGPSVALQTDPLLLGRVLGNLLKNALEAVPRGGVVTVSHAIADDDVVFRVHNPGEVAPEVRHHLFERSVSTKGAGRGLGTYSVRLFTEKYLGGRLAWSSSAAAGTTVKVALPRT